MAIELERQGIPFRIVDKSTRPAQWSQALVVHARTLEQFERYGIAEKAVQRGRALKHAAVISEGKTIVSFPFDKIPGHYPFLLFLPQSDTEALLIEHLESLGKRIERGVEVVDIAEKGDAVEIQLRHADGGSEMISADWVVGCDGAHSAVREGLRIPFSGVAVGLNFFLGDLELEGPDLMCPRKNSITFVPLDLRPNFLSSTSRALPMEESLSPNCSVAAKDCLL